MDLVWGHVSSEHEELPQGALPPPLSSHTMKGVGVCLLKFTPNMG